MKSNQEIPQESRYLIMKIDEILTATVQAGASDLHIKPGIVPIVRKHGELYALDPLAKRLTAEQVKELADSIMQPKHIEKLEINREVDMGYGVAGVGRFRVSIFHQRGSLRMVFRAIPDRVPSLKELNLPEVLENISQYERGLILCTGATGAGKSTTLAAMVDAINQNSTKHIITIEDPIEYLLRDRRSIITQREIGSDAVSFIAALRAALRQDPDVILIGEMRDKETIQTALVAAETGHLVLSTLHTSDTTESIGRMLSAFEPHQHTQIRMQIASNLRAIVSQRLAKRADGKGSVPACEVLINNARVQQLIMDPQKTREIEKVLEESYNSYRMQSFDQSLMDLLSRGLIDVKEALQLSSRPGDFEMRYRGIMSQGGHVWNHFDKNKNPETWGHIEKLEVQKLRNSDEDPDPEVTKEESMIIERHLGLEDAKKKKAK